MSVAAATRSALLVVPTATLNHRSSALSSPFSASSSAVPPQPSFLRGLALPAVRGPGTRSPQHRGLANRAGARAMADGGKQLQFGKGITLQKGRTWDEGLENKFEKTPLEDIFKGKKVVLFGLPGAFTGVCSRAHVPSYKRRAADFKKLGVDKILCVSVNDPYVMNGWAKALDVNTEDIEFYGDFDVSFNEHLGLTLDLTAALMGKRSKRYGMYVEDGVIKHLNVEEDPGNFKVSDADTLYKQLGGKLSSEEEAKKGEAVAEVGAK